MFLVQLLDSMGNHEGDEKKISVWKKWWFWTFIGVLVVGKVISYRPSTKVSTSETTSIQATPTPVRDLQELRGRFMNYDYTILFKDDVPKYVATFKPFLPRNDAVTTGAMLEVVGKVYGKHTLKSLKPQMVLQNGIGLIMFEGTGRSYYFLLIKEDTGETHSMSFWAE